MGTIKRLAALMAMVIIFILTILCRNELIDHEFQQQLCANAVQREIVYEEYYLERSRLEYEASITAKIHVAEWAKLSALDANHIKVLRESFNSACLLPQKQERGVLNVEPR